LSFGSDPSGAIENLKAVVNATTVCERSAQVVEEIRFDWIGGRPEAPLNLERLLQCGHRGAVVVALDEYSSERMKCGHDIARVLTGSATQPDGLFCGGSGFRLARVAVEERCSREELARGSEQVRFWRLLPKRGENRVGRRLCVDVSRAADQAPDVVEASRAVLRQGHVCAHRCHTQLQQE
jgi:hypothetical protein